jgi:hypothetical protein
MSGEVRSRWQALIAQFERDRFFQKRYANCAKEPKALFNRIGEDLDSSNESIRNGAYWAVVHLTPELINILHEKEIRNPGWQDMEGKDQKIVNEGIDGSKCILKHLHTKLVKEHDLKVRDGNKKDPRPYLKKAIDNWKIDEYRSSITKDGAPREVLLGYEAALEIPDDDGSPEDYIIETETYNYDSLWEEYKFYFRGRDAFDVFMAHHVDNRPLEEIRERWGISSDKALRRKKSRISKEMVARRDKVFTCLLFGLWDESVMEGKFPRSTRDPERSGGLAERAKRSIHAGRWVNGVAADGNSTVAVRSLTTGLRDAPAHIYLVAIKKDQEMTVMAMKLEIKGGRCLWVPSGISNVSLNKYFRYVKKVINPTGDPRRNGYISSLLEAGTQFPGLNVPGLNDALDEVPNDYYAWLISNSF